MADVRERRESGTDFPALIYFCMADEDEAQRFFAKHHPESAVICDPEKRFYHDFGAKRATAADLFGPKPLAKALALAVRGVLPGKIVGDAWQMPAIVLVEKGRIVREHEFTHAADHPDWDDFIAASAR